MYALTGELTMPCEFKRKKANFFQPKLAFQEHVLYQQHEVFSADNIQT